VARGPLRTWGLVLFRSHISSFPEHRRQLPWERESRCHRIAQGEKKTGFCRPHLVG
jgi:hypothetical protein